MSGEILTIGHSTHSLDEFLALLGLHQIETLVDIRRFPGSRRLPHFNQSNLASALQKVRIEYLWMEVLGGRRPKEDKDGSLSANAGLRNQSFRNYADYMLTEAFRDGIRRLVEFAARKPTAIMCAESLFWRCHRRLVSDFLVANEVAVQHIMPNGELRPHQVTNGAVIVSGKVTYPGEQLLFT